MAWIAGYIVLALIGLPVIYYLCRKPMVKRAYRWPFAVVGTALFVLTLYGIGLRPVDHNTQMDVERFAELPVQYEGRLMPIDTVARSTLRVLRQKESVETPSGLKLHAIDWLLWVMAKPEEASQLPVFRVDHPQVRSFFNLPADGKFASYADMWGRLPEFEQALSAMPQESADRSAYERQMYKLANAIRRYNDLGSSFHSGVNRPDINALDLVRTYGQWGSLLKEAAGAARKAQAGETLESREEALLGLIDGTVPIFERMAVPSGRIAVVPPPPGEVLPETAGSPVWRPIGQSLIDTLQTGAVSPVVTAYATVILAYDEGNVDVFNTAVDALHRETAQPAAVADIALEEAFNRSAPFYVGSGLYVMGLILLFVSWLRWSEPLRQTAFWMLLLTFGLHTAALVARMVIMDRPAPVTNLYSSAIFIGWAACGMGLLLEQMFKNSFGLLVASVIGFITLVIAHNLDNAGDTMEAMRAVLDSNFWLATHVVTITLGYTPMFIAGLLAIAYVLRGIFTKDLTREMGRSLTRMVYGILAFALILSFIGTMLGGIWADQSWGRFWGWDPKENGALMIVLWVALILHGRIAGMFRERGIMLLTIGGNIITAWSWFGTNQLGIGLHSYGFTDSGHMWLMIFWGANLGFIALGLLPMRYWRSAAKLQPERFKPVARPDKEGAGGSSQTQSAPA
ncbi:MAG: cytochrome c biogenesis protein [Opitutales bacterium]